MENTNLSDLNNQTLAQLRQTAKELNIKSVTKYKKAELIEQIKEHANKLKSTREQKQRSAVTKLVVYKLIILLI